MFDPNPVNQQLESVEKDVHKIIKSSTNLNDFVKLIKILKTRLTEYKAIQSKVNEWLDQAIEKVDELMNEQEVTSTAKVKGVGHLTQSDPYVYARVTNKDEFHKYLQDNDMHNYIVEAVPPATVRKITSDLLKLGKAVPEGVEVYFKPNIKLIKEKNNG